MKKILGKLLFITLGSFIAAFALEDFLVPNKIIDGGIVGISIMVSYLTRLPLALFVVVLNIPFIFMAYKKIGRSFVVYTGYSVFTFALFLTLLEGSDIATKDLFLTSIFGGILLGLGVGLILRNGACLDGTEILALRVNKKMPFTVGEIIMFFNIFIFICAGFVFEPDRAMYSGITYFTAYRVIDLVLQGLNESKSIFVISDKDEEIGQAIMQNFDKSVTYIPAQGGYSGAKKKMVYCVVSRFEITKIKEVVNMIDDEAFISIENVHEVDGKRYRKGRSRAGA